MQRIAHGVFASCLVVWFGMAFPALLPGDDGQGAGPISVTQLENASSRERVVYVPFQRMREILSRSPGSVFLPLQEYLQLWQSVPTDPAAVIPVAAVIRQASYTATIQKDVAKVEAVFSVQVLKQGWSELPVSFGEAAIAKFSSDIEPVFLRSTAPGKYMLMFSRPGNYTLTIELAARVRSSPEGRSLTLTVPSVAMTTFELTVPEADQQIHLQPQLILEPGAAAAGTSTLRANVGATGEITARWHPRTGTRPDMELLASATNVTLVTIEDGLVHTDAHFSIDILRGQVEQLRFAIPAGQRVLDVTAETAIREWTLSQEAERQILVVNLVNRQSGKIPVVIHTEMPLPSEPFPAAGLAGNQAFGVHALDVLRENGQIAIKAPAELQMNVVTQEGLARIDESDMDPRLRKPGAIYFRFYSPKCRLDVAARPVAPRITVVHNAQLTVLPDQLRLNSRLAYQIERAGVFEFHLRIPEGMTLEHLTCNGLKQFDLASDQRRVTVSLLQSMTGQIDLDIVLTRPRDAATDSEQFEVPMVVPEGVEVETGRLALSSQIGIELTTEPDSIVGFQPDPEPDYPEADHVVLASGWTFSRRPLGMSVQLRQKPTRLTAKVGSRLDVRPGLVRVSTRLIHDVEYAGLDTFRFAVPESVADSVQIEPIPDSGTTIRQKDRSEPADGWVIWRVILQREMTGVVGFLVTYDVRPVMDDGATTGITQNFRVPLLRALEPFDDSAPTARRIAISRISGEVTSTKDRTLAVTARAEGGDVESIDVRELTLLEHDGFAAFRYFQQPVEVALQANRYDVQPVVETIISRGLAEFVIDRSGVALVRARYVTRSSQRQRLRIDLPKGNVPLGAEVDGQDVALEKNPDARPTDGWEAYYINVARTKASDEPFLVALQYRTELTPRPFENRGGRLLLRLPVIGGGDGHVPVQQLRIVTWIPEDFVLVGTPRGFERLKMIDWRSLWRGRTVEKVAADHESWLGSTSGGVFDFPREGRPFEYAHLGGRDRIEFNWWNGPFYTQVISGALVLIALLLRWTTWENKLTLLVLAAFVGSVAALRDADLVLQGLLAARYGLIAMILIWLIHAVVGSRSPRRGSTPPAPPGVPQAVVIPPPGIFDTVTLGMKST